MNINVFGCRFGRCILYQRYLVAIVAAIGFVNLYCMRYAIRVTLPYLVNKTSAKAIANQTQLLCGKREDDVFEQLGTPVTWTTNQISALHSSFYFSYVISHIPAGIISDMYGPRHVLSFGMMLTCLVTLLSPTTIDNGSWLLGVIMRQFLGTGQGVSMTAIFSLVSNWTPNHQISSLVALGYSGTAMAQVVLTGSVYIFFQLFGSWVALFYFWSGISIAWYCIYLCLVFSAPSSHPFVSKEEKDLIIADLGVGYPKSIPWKAILSDNCVWALLSGQIGHNWILFVLATNLHKYFKEVLGLNLKSNFVMQAVPYACMWFTVIASGFLGDHLINRNILPVVYLRIIYTAIGNILPSIFILIAMYIECHKPVLLLFCILALMCKGFVIAGLKANILDITRHYVGTVFAIQNGLGAATGLVIPYTMHYMCQNNTKEEWRKAFWLSFAISTFSSTLYFIWSRSDRSSWDNINSLRT